MAVAAHEDRVRLCVERRRALEDEADLALQRAREEAARSSPWRLSSSKLSVDGLRRFEAMLDRPCYATRNVEKRRMQARLPIPLLGIRERLAISAQPLPKTVLPALLA